jgi:O-antigen ligase
MAVDHPPRPVVAPVPVRTRRRWSALHPVDWLLVVCVLGVAYVGADLPGHVQPGDLPLAVAALLGLRVLGRDGHNPFATPLRRVVRWLWLLGLAVVLSFSEIGLPSWALTQATRDLVAPVVLLAIAALCWTRREVAGNLTIVWAVTAVPVALSTLRGQGSGLRQIGAFFENPNYTAHYLATSLIVVMSAPMRLTTRLAFAGLYILAMTRTGSFGGFAVLIGWGVYLGLQVSRFLPAPGRLALNLVAVAFVTVFLVAVTQRFETADADFGSGLSSERFDRSSNARLEYWKEAADIVPDHPLGVGAAGLTFRHDLGLSRVGEAHNDLLGFLLAYGVLGLIAFVGICSVLWRALPDRLEVRGFAFGLALSSFTREVINFRHAWLALALLIAVSTVPRRRVRR